MLILWREYSEGTCEAGSGDRSMLWHNVRPAIGCLSPAIGLYGSAFWTGFILLWVIFLIFYVINGFGHTYGTTAGSCRPGISQSWPFKNLQLMPFQVTHICISFWTVFNFKLFKTGKMRSEPYVFSAKPCSIIVIRSVVNLQCWQSLSSRFTGVKGRERGWDLSWSLRVES